MLPAPVQKQLQEWLKNDLSVSTVGGGSINHAYKLTTGAHHYFCKLNSRSKYPSLFEYEKQGLEVLAQQQVIRVPKVLHVSEVGDHQVLLMEWIEQGLKTDTFWTNFGKQLAALHHQQGSHFGLDSDNYMGSLPQYNTWHAEWTAFFIHQRLQPQITLALQNKLLEPSQISSFEKLYTKLPEIFPPEPPCLLHGDLWSGNYLCDDHEQPVLIDPAVYYGHRCIDLAMTTLFGGFDQLFYESYQYHYPLPANYRQQWEICNLYPLLIHLNLFGKSYLADILHTIRRY
jgi:protein-ribulosamine 3-kinase